MRHQTTIPAETRATFDKLGVPSHPYLMPMKFIRTLIPVFGLLAFVASPLIAEDKKEAAPAATAEAKKEPAAAAETKEEEKFDVEVVITGNDTLQFDKKAFTVTSGQKVKLTFKNIGNLPKVAMGHNLVILKPGSNVVEFGNAAIPAGLAADYIPAAKKKEIFAHTKLLGPKEEQSIFFTAPERGKYPYLCSFPAHYGAMSGVMTVK